MRHAVYPRLRGEHPLRQVARLGSGGLSPLARGTLRNTRRKRPRPRFIPACAGNICSMRRRTPSPAVYPRLRGEHKGSDQPLLAAVGLSPLARGTSGSPNLTGLKDRFIPACAGNIPLPVVAAAAVTVYPRLRGEHARLRRAAITAAGLSPLARGTSIAVTAGVFSPRFIPACAGNIPSPVNRINQPTVYPRLRGEHKPGQYCGGNANGLSPLARGTWAVNHLFDASVRFIPACAGNIR